MLDVFANVGTTSADVTWTNTAGEKKRFRRKMPLADLNRLVPRILDDATRQQRNVIVRPEGHSISRTSPIGGVEKSKCLFFGELAGKGRHYSGCLAGSAKR